MAWNPSPEVAAARGIGKQFNKPMVIILMFGEDGLSYASYGSTRKQCDFAKTLADVAFDAVMKELEDE